MTVRQFIAELQLLDPNKEVMVFIEPVTEPSFVSIIGMDNVNDFTCVNLDMAYAESEEEDEE